ncbi:tas-like protein [Dunaliella salina]|uniref:Tas-like protein n=1 Tax=Dunaliella salina TaxID=3046 RepID=A0ABQ7GBL4_DUNSA|nr:tas-like protein [Dunaliella salina]|eukprot:KAF5831998.1 tas-like protein [Dunaliella salina]
MLHSHENTVRLAHYHGVSGIRKASAGPRKSVCRPPDLHASAALAPHSQAPEGRHRVPVRRLGRTELQVPVLCFGTMLFGEGNSYEEACLLLDKCMANGVNFFDSAEMYPVPQRAETAGKSERLLGQWIRERKHPRHSILISTKVCGPSGQMEWIRGGPHKVDAANIAAAIDGSLQRLGTDYIDLVSIHWPDRYVPMFGDVDYDPRQAFSGAVPLEEQLEALGHAVAQGKVRHVGLSNETPYGLTRAILAAEAHHLPRVCALQNAYSLTCRTFDAGLAEVCHLEDVSLMAYSPLAMGLLTGKYLAEDGGPPTARLNKYRGRYAEAESRYGPRPAVQAAVAAYCNIAQKHGMSPTEMAMRFVLGHPLVAAAVAGATCLPQLEELIASSCKPCLPEEIMEEIDAVHASYPSPTP